MMLPEKRKNPGEGMDLRRQVRTLRNWNLGIPDSEEEDAGLSTPEWLEEEQETEDDWYRNYGLGKTRKIGLGPNDLSYRIPGFEEEGAGRPPLVRPLRQDGTASKDKDDEFFGKDWREDYITAVKRRDKDPFYIFLQKLAGATNTTVINLLSPPDVETRALRAGAIVESRREAMKLRLGGIDKARKALEAESHLLVERERELEESKVEERDVKNAKAYKEGLKARTTMFDASTEAVRRFQDYIVINNAFARWVRSEEIEFDGEDLVNALDNRLESFGSDIAPITPIKKSPGLRRLESEDRESARRIREEASRLASIRERDRTNDTIFLGLWILYENRDKISKDQTEEFSGYVDAIFDVLRGVKNFPQKTPRGRGFQFPGDDGREVLFIKMDGTIHRRMREYLSENLQLGAYPDRGASVQTVLQQEKDMHERERARNAELMVEFGVEALIFNRNLLKPIPRLPDVVPFREQSMEDARRTVDRIDEALDQIIISGSKDIRTIKEAVDKTRRNVGNLQDEIERLIQPRPEGLEPVIPYRPEGTWAMDSMFTGWVPLAPIVVYGIEQAYQLVADHVPRLAATDSSSETQIKKAVDVLQTDPRYRVYFVQITARQMGLSRQAFNVRWMPDLTGDHMRVIMYNMRKLRETAGRNVDAHFRRALRVM